jgi:predicted DNA-binding antitoxin AbrB/MazE fold protein
MWYNSLNCCNVWGGLKRVDFEKGDVMPKIIEAIYKQGIIRPINPIEGVKENSRIKVRIIKSQEKKNPILKFAGILSDEEANSMINIIEEEFEKVNPDEWKD